jgi:hypothetical protein
MATVNPHRIEMKINILPPVVHYFVDPVKGRLPRENINYVQIERPQGIPSYAIANLQDFYLTPEPASFILPLFINLPEIFFSEFDNYHTITEIDKFRLDLIAHRFYIQVEYWWIIALANEILDPFNIPINKILRIPSEEVVINKWLQRPLKKRRVSNEFFFGTV